MSSQKKLKIETNQAKNHDHSVDKSQDQVKYNYLYQIFKEQLLIKKKRMDQIHKKASLYTK
jgi:hypothetical protein